MTASAAISYAVWAALGLGVVVLVWASLRGVCASPGDVVSRLATTPGLRVLFVLGVMWGGWHLFAR